MSGALAPRTPGLLALAGAGLIAALASGRPELALLSMPLLVFAGAGLVLAREPSVAAEIELDRTRLLEGEAAVATVLVRNDGADRVQVELAPVRSRYLALDPEGVVAVDLPAGAVAQVEFAASPRRWGAHSVGPLAVRARDPLGVTTWEGRLGRRLHLRAFPREQRLRELVAPLRTQPFLGTHVARARGEGIEFADIRPFRVGDRVRQINWRATARRGEPQVNERHPEHSSDVVLLLDTFEEARDQAGGTLDSAVRAAAALARAHLARRDRVGLVDFGGTLHWLEPGFGTNQLYRIIDALLASDIAFSYAWRNVDSIPLQGPATRSPGPGDLAPARQALGRAGHRPAPAGVRPDRDRGLPAGSHRSRAVRRGCRGVRAVAPSAGGAARPPAVARHRRRGMGARRNPRTRARGGEHIPPLRPARRARLATGLAASVLLVSLAALVTADAGSASQLAWLGAGVAALLLTVGLVGESFTAVHAAIAVLGTMFLLRHDTRLLLAPAYGAGLLLIDDLAAQSIELSGVSQIGLAVIGARTGAALLVAAIGACASAAAALAVTAAPGRSVALTALGAVAAVAAFAAIVGPVRRRYGTAAAVEPTTTPSRPVPEGSTLPTE